MFDEVAAYLVLAPIAIMIAVVALGAIWAVRRRPQPVNVEGDHRISD